MILYDILLEILKDPASYCLRERFAREPDLIKYYLAQEPDSQEFYFGLCVVDILQKYNPHLLILPHFLVVLNTIRYLWT
jgi:transposase